MMMRLTKFSLITPAAALALVVGGCDAKPAAPAAKRTEIRVRSESQKRLAEASELNRAIALKRAIMDSGASCKRVAKTGFVGPYKNMDFWTASCADSFDRTRDWAVFIGADDSVQVRLCTDAKAAGLPACTVQPGTGGGSGMSTKKRAG
jgi:hypothetical protein